MVHFDRPCTVLYKVEIKSQEFCQFHMKGDAKCFNLRYVLHNSYARIWKFLYHKFLGGFSRNI